MTKGKKIDIEMVMLKKGRAVVSQLQTNTIQKKIRQKSQST